MEQKLAQFRRSKQSESQPTVLLQCVHFFRKLYNNVTNFSLFGQREKSHHRAHGNEKTNHFLPAEGVVGEEPEHKNSRANYNSGSSLKKRGTAVKPDQTTEQTNDECTDSPTTTWLARLLKFSLWCLIVYILSRYELAGPFVLVSAATALIYFGTSRKARKKTELSAYSVFNPNCVRIEGTLTAEQFENEILRRPLDSGRRN